MADLSLRFSLAAALALVASVALYAVHVVGKRRDLGAYATAAAFLSLTFLTISLGLRWLSAGYVSATSLYEFALCFAWGALAVYLYVESRHQERLIGLLVLPVPLALMIYATRLPAEVRPLSPALQSPLLPLHVIAAAMAYGAGAVGFGVGALRLVQLAGLTGAVPARPKLDEVGYQAASLAFPLLLFALLVGAFWADQAWGRFWGWDPKETATLATILVYAGYLHSWGLRGWRGRLGPPLLVAGFLAIALTFLGSLAFGGLHSFGS